MARSRGNQSAFIQLIKGLFLKIAHIIPTYYPAVRYGGPIRAVHNLCKHLVARGHSVEVFTTNADGDGVLDSRNTNVADIDGVGVQYFPVRQPRRLYYSPDMAKALEMRTAEFDILHLHSTFLYPTLKAARCAISKRVPYVIAPRGMLVKHLVNRKNRILKKAWIALFERRTIEQAAALHVTSALEALEIRKFGFSLPPILEIPNGFEPPAVRPVCARKTETLLFLGRLDRKKGIERLISAMALLDGARLIIAGNDEVGYTPELRALCERLGVSRRVEFAGPVEGDDKWQLYLQATVFVLPSYSENLANTVLEAMAMECPAVVTPEVGLAEVVEQHGAGVVCTGDPDSLADAIRSILENPVAASRMGRNGRAVVERQFRWDDIACDMETAYSDIVAIQLGRAVA